MTRTAGFCTNLIVLVLMGSGPLSAQDPPEEDVGAPPDSTAFLVFAWEPGISADVILMQRMVREGEGTDSDLSIRSTFRMDVSEHEDGLLVLNHSGRLEEFESVPDLPDDNFLFELYQALCGVDAGYIVSTDGEFLDVVGATEAADAFRSAMGPVLDSVASVEELAPLMGAFEQMLTPSAMTTAAAEQWGGMVWAWAWEEFEDGVVYSAEGEAPSPLLPDVVIPMEYEFGFLERVPCTPEPGEERACVMLEIYSYPDSEVVVTLLDDFMARMGAALGEFAVRFVEFEQENHVQVVVDPDTMVPFSFKTSKAISGVMEQNGQNAPFSRLDLTDMTFRYRSGN